MLELRKCSCRFLRGMVARCKPQVTYDVGIRAFGMGQWSWGTYYGVMVIG